MTKIKFTAAEGKRIQITNKQRREIKSMYKASLNDIKDRQEFLKNKTNISSVTRRQYLDELSKAIKDNMNDIDGKTNTIILNGMKDVADAVVKNNKDLMKMMGFPDSLVGVSNLYIPKDVVKEVMSGSLYEGKWTLSKAIWGDNEKKLKEIDYIVAKGIAENKSAYDLAKDLEKYVNPSAKKDWEWSKVYPGTRKVIDYNAQRLARTMVSHAYEESFVRVTKDNPFIEAYQWIISNSDRVCPICIERAEDDAYGLGAGIFPKDKLPLDHPNGMCTFDSVLIDSMKGISDKIADWINGTGDSKLNEEIDKYANIISDGKFEKKFSLYNAKEKEVSNVVNGKDVTQREMNFVGCNEYVKSVVPEVLNEYESTFQITPQIKNVVMNEKDFTDLMSSAYAYIKKDDNTTLYLNPSVFKSDDELLSIIGGRIKAYHNNANAKSILVHELSHSVGSKIGNVQYEAVDYAVSNFMSTYTKTAMDFGLADWQIAGENISRYSTTTKEELFAEAFADVYKNKDKAEQISKDIIDYIKRANK